MTNVLHSIANETSPVLLMVRVEEAIGIQVKAVVKSRLPKEVDSVKYEIADNVEFQGHILVADKSLKEPMNIIYTTTGKKDPRYIRATVYYKDGDILHTGAKAMGDLNIPTVHDYMNPKRVFKDKEGRTYTITVDSLDVGKVDGAYSHGAISEYCEHKSTYGNIWSLPTREEFQVLDDLYSLGIGGMEGKYYWTSTVDVTNQNFAYMINPQTNHATLCTKQSIAHARLVKRNYLAHKQAGDNIVAVYGEDDVESRLIGSLDEVVEHICAEVDRLHYATNPDADSVSVSSGYDSKAVIIEELLRVAAMLGEQEEVTLIDQLASGNLQALALILEQGFDIIPKLPIK